MNYIKQLEHSNNELAETIVAREDRVQELRAYLCGPKFAQDQSDGSRGDLVGVADILRWLAYIESPAN